MSNYRVIFRPFSFLTIKHPTFVFPVILWVIPTLASLTFLSVIFFIDKNINLWGNSGIIEKISSFIQSLPGFYIAALAAVATFGNRSLDKTMPGTAPTLSIPFNGGWIEDEPLNRRLFLTSMFAYLTTLSIIITIVSIVSVLVAPSIKLLIPITAAIYLKYLFTFLIFTFIIQLFIISLWGISYLGEKMHLSDGNSDH